MENTKEYLIHGKRVNDKVTMNNNVIVKTSPYFRYMTGWGLSRFMQYILNNRLSAEQVNVAESDC